MISVHTDPLTAGRYWFDDRQITYEDELPDMTKDEYRKWFELSWVDIVRMGPTPRPMLCEHGVELQLCESCDYEHSREIIEERAYEP